MNAHQLPTAALSPDNKRSTTPQRQQHSLQDQKQDDVWDELFGIVHNLAETVGLSLQAFTPSEDKAISAITKKRLALRSLHGLKQGQLSIQALHEHLKALQAASQTWQRSMMYASKSHQELMEQVESTTEELHRTSERLRVLEAQRLAAVREAESLRTQLSQQEALINELQGSMKQREEELETLQFTAHEAQADASGALKSLDLLKQEATKADERARTATAALEDAKAEAAKAQGLAERHQQVVAKLTADNLVFLMQLKKAEADLAVANQERSQLRLAAEHQRGPWFDQVRAGVEERVRQAMQRSQELEARLEQQEGEHAKQLEAVEVHRAQLEEQLASLRCHAEELQGRLDAAVDAQQRADGRSAASEATAAELRQRLDDLAAENRVLQESVRAMRQECTERWVSEQAALGRVGGLDQRIQALEQMLEEQTAQLAALQRQLETQTAVNRQLMSRKEEIEWQLMAAMAKLDGGTAEGPVPLNLRVSGLLQVGGRDQRSSGVQASATGLGGLKAVGPTQSSCLGGASLPAHVAAAAAADGASEAPTDRANGTGEPDVPRPSLLPEPTLLLAGPDDVAPASQKSCGSEGVTAMRDDVHSSFQLQLQRKNATRESESDRALFSSPPPTGPAALNRGSSTARAVGAGSTDAMAHSPSANSGSTGNSSPPSSVAISTEPSSPRGEASHATRTVSSRAPAAAEAESVVAIRTVSAGSRLGLGGGGRIAHEYRGPGCSNGFAHGPEGSRVGGGAGAGTDACGLGTATHGVGSLGSQGSLHDGGNVWLADAGGSASSDDGDFLADGIIVQRQTHGCGPSRARPPQQALLYELQEQLHGHFERPQVVAGTKGNQRQSLPAQQPAPEEMEPWERSDLESMRQAQERHTSNEGKGQPASAMPFYPSWPGVTAYRNGPRSPLATSSLASMHGDFGLSAGIFSISKGSGAQPSARAGARGSPLHPVFGTSAAHQAVSANIAASDAPASSSGWQSRPSALAYEPLNEPYDQASSLSGPAAHQQQSVVSTTGQGAVEGHLAAVDSSGRVSALAASCRLGLPGAGTYLNVSHSHDHSMGPVPARPSSVKSVRFSEDNIQVSPQQRRSSSEHSEPDWSLMRGNLRTSASQGQLHGRSMLQRVGSPYQGEDQQGASPPASHGQHTFRQQGPLQHPAIMAPIGSSMATTDNFLDGLEETPSKRYSAAGVFVTAVPRGPPAPS